MLSFIRRMYVRVLIIRANVLGERLYSAPGLLITDMRKLSQPRPCMCTRILSKYMYTVRVLKPNGKSFYRGSYRIGAMILARVLVRGNPDVQCRDSLLVSNRDEVIKLVMMLKQAMSRARRDIDSQVEYI